MCFILYTSRNVKCNVNISGLDLIELVAISESVAESLIIPEIVLAHALLNDDDDIMKIFLS